MSENQKLDSWILLQVSITGSSTAAISCRL